MAEENPKIEINIPPKRINNSREAFLFENENLIIGKKGLTFQYYPTKNEKLKYYLNIKYNQYKNNHNNAFYKTFYNNKNIFNNTTNSTKNIFYNEKINKNSFLIDNKFETIPKSMSQTNFFQNPSKNIYQNSNLQENNKYNKKNISNIKHRGISSLLNEAYKNNNKNILSDNSLLYGKLNTYRSNKDKKYKKFLPISHPKFQMENKLQKVNYLSLSKLKKIKAKQKKMPEAISHKTHFKGLESIYIKPKEIYDLFKKEDAERLAKLGFFDINEKKEKEKKRLEKRNEYKSDIKELMEEEKEIQHFINTKEFAELLGNNKYFKDAEYNDISKYSDEETKTNFFSETEMEKNNKLNYLKKIAFEEKKVEKKPKAIPIQLSVIKKKKDGDKKDINSEDESFFEEIKRSKKMDNINILMQREDQLKVEGKVYHMKNEMDKICKELLNKYKIHNVLKK